jgi:hypothetical protein
MATKELPWTLPIDEPTLTKIGAFIVTWNMIEHSIDWIVAAVSRLDLAAVAAIMSTPHVPSRADVFEAVVKSSINDEEFITKATRIAKRFKELSNRLNEVAHGRWVMSFVDVGQGQKIYVPMSQKQFLARNQMPLADLDKHYTVVCDLATDAIELRNEAYARLWRQQREANPEHQV